MMKTMLVQQAMTILLLTLWLLVTLGIGRLCLRATAIRFSSLGEWHFLSGGIGLTVVGYAFFLLAAAGSLSPTGIALLLLCLATLSIAGWIGPIRTPPAPPARRSIGEIASSLLLALLLIAAFALTLTPESGKDALIYHLAVPKLYLTHRGFYFIAGNIFAGYPLLGEMHYLLALFLQNDILAKAMHFSLLCGILFGIGLFSRHILREQRYPRVAMLLFVSIPSVFAVSHSAYNDLFVAFFTLSALYSFLRWSDERDSGWLLLGGLFSGAAAACKYTALLLAPLGCLGILWLAHRNQNGARETFRNLTLYAAAALIAGCPFYLKSWLMTGNPFYPFFHGFFGGRGWDADQARLYDLFIQDLGMGRELLDYLLLPWNVSLRAKIDSAQFDGILGPLFLLTLPFLVMLPRLERPLRILLAYALLTFLFWASSAQQIRYLIPLLPPLAIAVGAILSGFRRRRGFFALLIFLIAGSLTFNGWHISRGFLQAAPLAAAAGLESRDDYLARRLPTYPMYRFVNETLPPDAKIYLIYMKNFTFLCDRGCYADAMFEAHGLQKILREESSAPRVRERLKAAGFTHLLYDEYFLLGEPSPLTAAEKRLFLSFRDGSLEKIRQQRTYRLDRLI